MGADADLKMDDTVKAVLEKYSWDAYPSKHLKYFEIGAFDLETSLATDDTLHICDQNVSDADCVALGKLLRMMRPENMKSIYMSNNRITDAGCAAMAQGAASLPNIELFYVARNEISDAGVSSVAQHLAKTKLWQLVLSENKFGDAGVAALAEAVQRDATAFAHLKWLFLDHSEISDKGVAQLATALTKGMKAVTRLALQNCKLTNRGLKSLADAISAGALPACEFLYVQENAIDAEGKKALKAVTKPRGIRVHFGWPQPLPGVDYE